MTALRTDGRLKKAGEKVAIGPRTLALLTRPSAMDQLTEESISRVTAGLGKRIGKKMTPRKAMVELRSGRMKALDWNQSATKSIQDKARFEPTFFGKVQQVLEGRGGRSAGVPGLFKGTEAARKGRAARDIDAAALAARNKKLKGPGVIQQSAERLRAVTQGLKPQAKGQPIPAAGAA